jgi:ABC-2 type transport system ATP-binding protein
MAILQGGSGGGQARDMTTGKVPGGGVVLSRLCKSYGQVRAVRPLDLVIAPGETVAVLGPNGAGKTTVLDMMLGLTRPDSGSVSLFGMPPARAAKAGMVSSLYPRQRRRAGSRSPSHRFGTVV